jgi:hypothetical protein
MQDTEYRIQKSEDRIRESLLATDADTDTDY